MIKTFRGVLADGGQERIRLSTNTGLVGYKILKFEILPHNPGDVQQESIVQLFRQEVGTVPTTAGEINFESPLLMAAVVGFYGAVASNNSQSQTVIFDSEIVNQDIYVTHTDNASNQKINYYVEMEQVKLDLNEATVATLKNMRGRE